MLFSIFNCNFPVVILGIYIKQDQIYGEITQKTNFTPQFALYIMLLCHNPISFQLEYVTGYQKLPFQMINK